MATLRELRRKADLTQAEVAAKVGVSNVTLGKWENGKTTPTQDSLSKLAIVYGVTPADIMLQGKGEEHLLLEETPQQVDAASESTNYIISLSAGTIALTSTINFFALSHEERRLMMTLLDTLEELKTPTAV